jgi:predicted component of type VI protein secretion system
VSEKPVTIGTSENCDIRLPAAAGIAEEHARLWWRDGRLMLHHIAPNLVTLVGSREILWTSLEDGDEAAIGPYTLRISVGRQEIQTKEEAAPVEYSLDLPLEQPQLAHAG